MSNHKSNLSEIDLFIPIEVKQFLEDNYYLKVNQQLVFDKVIFDNDFLQNPSPHLALYTDHGVVHVRNVTNNILELLHSLNGVHFQKRNPRRLQFMKGYGVLIAYLHDAGMVDCSTFGRIVHAEYIVHEIFKPEFDEIISLLWQTNAGNVPWHIHNLINEKIIIQPAKIVFREMLAMAYCHSKSAVPSQILNDIVALRQNMQRCLSQSLNEIYLKKQIKKCNDFNENKVLKSALKKEQKLKKQDALLVRHYGNSFFESSFLWLNNTTPALIEFLHDVIDTIRILRCADALRQRGTVLKTSGLYQMFINQKTGNVIYALSTLTNKTFLLEVTNPINAGEANLESVDFSANGDLQFSFFHGAFDTTKAINTAAKNLAIVINDIQDDCINSLQSVHSRSNKKIKVILQDTYDNPNFVKKVAGCLIKLNPKIKEKILYSPSMYGVSLNESSRYLNEKDNLENLSLKEKREILRNVMHAGHHAHGIDIKKAFRYVKKIHIKKDEILLEALTPPGFAYIPLKEGLFGEAEGGYGSFKISAWSIIGNVSIIRNAVRNATIRAYKGLDLLVIPKTVYLKYWHKTYSEKQIKKVIIKLRRFHEK